MEFGLINRWFETRFKQLTDQCAHVDLGIGDDCAVFSADSDFRQVVSTDLLVGQRHFFLNANPWDVGFKSLAVNLSDLAAMGARPVGFTLGLALGAVDENWLDQFSAGLFQVAQAYQCPLIGGDTTGAPHPEDLLISITVLGKIPTRWAGLRRSAAKQDDEIWVSGLPGLARLGLLGEAQKRGCLADHLSDEDHCMFLGFWNEIDEHSREQCLVALNRPVPQLAIGQALEGLSDCALDLSDGLTGDLSHVCNASGLAAHLDPLAMDQIWLDWASIAHRYLPFLRKVSLMGGDDYQLCFTCPPSKHADVEALGRRLGVALSCIGTMSAGRGVLLKGDQRLEPVVAQSYDHFSTSGRG